MKFPPSGINPVDPVIKFIHPPCVKVVTHQHPILLVGTHGAPFFKKKRWPPTLLVNAEIFLFIISVGDPEGGVSHKISLVFKPVRQKTRKKQQLCGHTLEITPPPLWAPFKNNPLFFGPRVPQEKGGKKNACF